jgi:hypothetical protein
MSKAELLQNIEQDESHQLCSLSENQVITIHTLNYLKHDDVHKEIFRFEDDKLVSGGVRRPVDDKPDFFDCP